MRMIMLYTPKAVSCRLILNTFLHTVKHAITEHIH